MVGKPHGIDLSFLLSLALVRNTKQQRHAVWQHAAAGS